MIDDFLGKYLAMSGDTEQAEVINTFGKTLRLLCREVKTDDQLCAISLKLDLDGMNLISGLAEFVELRRKGPKQ